jgi:hypothetical protein
MLAYPLAKIQALFQRDIFHDAGPGPSSLSDHISGAGELTAEQALAVYRQMHRIRMLESMQLDFPATRVAVGNDRFHCLVTDYWREYPSQSYTLDHLGKNFPIYLAKRNSNDTFTMQLALFEQALNRIRMADESLSAAPEHLAARIDSDNILELIFVRPLTTEILSFDFDIADAYRTLLQQGPLAASPGHKPVNIIISRSNFSCRFRTICDPELTILSRLHDGLTLLEATEHLEMDGSELLNKISEWFNTWCSDSAIALST